MAYRRPCPQHLSDSPSIQQRMLRRGLQAAWAAVVARYRCVARTMGKRKRNGALGSKLLRDASLSATTDLRVAAAEPGELGQRRIGGSDNRQTGRCAPYREAGPFLSIEEIEEFPAPKAGSSCVPPSRAQRMRRPEHRCARRLPCRQRLRGLTVGDCGRRFVNPKTEIAAFGRRGRGCDWIEARPSRPRPPAQPRRRRSRVRFRRARRRAYRHARDRSRVHSQFPCIEAEEPGSARRDIDDASPRERPRR